MEMVTKKAAAGNVTVELNTKTPEVGRLVEAFKRMPRASQLRILAVIRKDRHATA